MKGQTQLIGSILGLARIAFDATTRGMDIAPQQVEKALEMAMNNSQMVQEETRKAVASWLANVQDARKVHFNTIDEGLANLERRYAKKSGKKS
jgi:hypothetical protein